MYKRRVWELEKTMPSMVALYERVKDVPNFIRARPSETYTDLHYLLDPGVDYWMVDNVGVIVLKRTWSPLVTEVHITMWDRRLRGREYLMKLCAIRALRERKCTLLTTAIPTSSGPTLAFAKRVGFQITTIVEGTAFLATSKRTLFTPSK